MSDDPVMKLRLEAWKSTIQVQQHFNEIEWKIRGLALTLITGVLGASAFAAKDGTVLHLRAFDLRLAAAILIAGEAIWFAFFFVDKIWYHRLLIGSVEYGHALEASFGNALPGAGLTHQISAASRYEFKWRPGGKERVLRSGAKLTIFYLAIAFVILVLIVGAQIGVSPPASSTSRGSTTTSSTSMTAPKPASSTANNGSATWQEPSVRRCLRLRRCAVPQFTRIPAPLGTHCWDDPEWQWVHVDR